jgi:hypothetical protein
MGQKLVKIYDLMKAEQGLQGQMRLAMKTGVSGPKAGTEPDSPENLAKFKAVFKEITGKDAPIN